MLAKFATKYFTAKSIKGRVAAEYLSDLAVIFEKKKTSHFLIKG